MCNTSLEVEVFVEMGEMSACYIIFVYFQRKHPDDYSVFQSWYRDVLYMYMYLSRYAN